MGLVQPRVTLAIVVVVVVVIETVNLRNLGVSIATTTTAALITTTRQRHTARHLCENDFEPSQMTEYPITNREYPSDE